MFRGEGFHAFPRGPRLLVVGQTEYVSNLNGHFGTNRKQLGSTSSCRPGVNP
jgi:hypothetical protein